MVRSRRVAVIDVSHWHSIYDAAYLNVLRALGQEIVGVSDANAAVAADRARRYETTPFGSYEEMIARTRPEFVIALGRHVDMPTTFRFLIESGLPFVMEKPWGVDADTVESLAALAAQRHAWVAAPFMTRTTFWALTAKKMMAAGEFGHVSHIFFRMIRPTMRRYFEWDSPWMASAAATGGGALMNLGAHGFDIARFITGEEPRVVSAAVSSSVHEAEVEDYAFASLRTPSGIIFHNEVGYTMPTWPENSSDIEWKVAGEKALLRMHPQGAHVLGPGRDEVIAAPEGFEQGFQKVIRDCLEALDNDRPPPITASDCAHAVRLISDAYRLAGSAGASSL